jgi:hypothetical protein
MQPSIAQSRATFLLDCLSKISYKRCQKSPKCHLLPINLRTIGVSLFETPGKNGPPF